MYKKPIRFFRTTAMYKKKPPRQAPLEQGPVEEEDNIYFQFINYLKSTEKDLLEFAKVDGKKAEPLERHHILPKHAGGAEDGPIVWCTPYSHTLAHYYRYLAYKETGDFVAYTMRRGQTMCSQDRAMLGVEAHRSAKTNFFDPLWQSKQGQKGGAKSGQKNALLHRQGEIMRETIKRVTYWEYKEQEKVIAIEVKPHKTFTAMVQFLRLHSPVEIKAVSDIAKIARGQRLRYYGWQLVAIDIDWDSLI